MNRQHKNTNFIKRAADHPFFKELDIRSSLVLVLGMLAFVIIFVDLTSDLASEKDEISAVIATLNKLDNPNTDVPHSGINLHECDNIIILQNLSVNQTDVIELHPDRAPPVL